VNQWDQIWKNRNTEFVVSENIFETFCALKCADGFDTQDVTGYYEAFWKQWHGMADRIEKYSISGVESVYEVGCGSGVNLYLFHKLKKIMQVGGLDYSAPLIAAAKEVLHTSDLICQEAVNTPVSPQYDVVLADSVFQYFEDVDYGMQVLEKMWMKARKMVVITEIHDQEKQEAHLNYRRACVQDYDRKYEGLDKTFYRKEMFQKFAERMSGRCIIVEPENQLYWNNRFVFDCYLCK
jgi:trans-aconitate methyltransferase